MLVTLADGDAARGRPSWREAASLARYGLGARVGGFEGLALMVTAFLLLVVALAPDWWWAERTIAFADSPQTSSGAEGPGGWRIVLASLAVLTIGLRSRSAALAHRLLPALAAASMAAVAWTAPRSRLDAETSYVGSWVADLGPAAWLAVAAALLALAAFADAARPRLRVIA